MYYRDMQQCAKDIKAFTEREDIKFVTFKNKLSMEMRHINCAFIFKEFVCEIQIMFTESQPSINYHVNHKLYEFKRAGSLEAFAMALSKIGRDYDDKFIVPCTPESY